MRLTVACFGLAGELRHLTIERGHVRPTDVEALEGLAEEIPLADASADAVAVGQAFHWFANAEALAEIHRVLRPAGALALVWNQRLESHPVQGEISRLLDEYVPDSPVRHAKREWLPVLAGSPLFGPIVEHCFARQRFLQLAESYLTKR